MNTELMKQIGRVTGRVAAGVATATVAMFTSQKIGEVEQSYRKRSLKKFARVYRERGKVGLKLHLLNSKICTDTAHADLFIQEVLPALDRINEYEKVKEDAKEAKKEAKQEHKKKKKEEKIHTAHEVQ